MDTYLEQLDELELSKSDYWILVRAYANSLPDAELLDLYSSNRFLKNEILRSLLKKRDAKALATVQHKTILQGLKTLGENRLSDKRVVPGDRALRDSLRARYEFASENDKRKILEAFLASYKTERLFAYSRLLDNWNDHFKQIIIDVYNQHHDKECLKVFIKHFSKSFLNSIFSDIEACYDYSYACYCVGREYVPTIDRQKLKPFEYLRLMVNFKRNVPQKEAETILYDTLADELKWVLYSHNDKRLDGYYKKEYKKEDTLLKSFPNVRRVIGALGAMGYTDSLLTFAKISTKIHTTIMKSEVNESDEEKVFDKIVALLPEPQRYGKYEIPEKFRPIKEDNDKVVAFNGNDEPDGLDEKCEEQDWPF